MPFKNVEAQKEFQRKWIQNKKDSYMLGKFCACGAPATEVFSAKSKGKTFSWSYSAAKLEEKLRIAKLMCSPCYRKENKARLKESAIVHSHAIGLGTPTYKTWASMKARCNNPNSQNYRWYGAKGVTVCERWNNSFIAFLEDMGERPAGTTIDRINPHGNYEPGNCRWANPAQQGKNKRGTWGNK